VIFGLAFTLLLIATYPERRKLVPERTTSLSKAPAAAPAPPAPTKPPETHSLMEEDTTTKS
jgi:hypothetical protein